MLPKIILRYKKHICSFICVSFLVRYLINRQKEKEYVQLNYNHRNLKHSINEIRLAGQSSVPPLNNLTSSYRLLKNPLQCKSKSTVCPTVDIIYLVKSSVENISQRMAIRDTWGIETTLRMVTIFIIGYSESFQLFIDLESKMYDDILQFDMLDIYDNLVYKTVFTIAWLCDMNIQTKFVHFVDDDRLLNTQNLLNLAFKRLPVFEMKMIGFKVSHARPYRKRSSKWYISVNEYEFDFWPPYLIGGTAITNMVVIKALKDGINYSKVIRIEDAYIGILANMLNISLEHNDGFLPVFVPGYKLLDKISSPDYKSYDILTKEWNILTSHLIF
ncbi:beta-1,3-galactosyltransferase brn-like isoform X2 [Mytilus californianus]|uniref:beta-1,3-galactosyltransferase brn-like isoform X2 n=1 Tax=Mytilus californianus TaxID=6549 RepID=UPI002245061B|nr:beta-1,3-galactosyltransferase brn-like isoform X2 [Mytilus californianus]